MHEPVKCLRRHLCQDMAQVDVTIKIKYAMGHRLRGKGGVDRMRRIGLRWGKWKGRGWGSGGGGGGKRLGWRRRRRWGWGGGTMQK